MGNIVEDNTGLHPLILVGANENDFFVWKMDKDHVVALAKLNEDSNGGPKTIVWQGQLKHKLVVRDINQVNATFYPVRSVF